MLKGLDPYLTPDLLRALAEMGHGDQLAIVDRNFPAHSLCDEVIVLPHSTNAAVLQAVLSIFPIDTFPGTGVIHMLTDEGEDSPAIPSAREIWNSAEGRTVKDTGVGRHGPEGFYALAKNAYVAVQTGETLPYACWLIPKGVIV